MNQTKTVIVEKELSRPREIHSDPEQDEPVAPEPEERHKRRRSLAWKGFNLRRQFSRVDIKSTVLAPQQPEQKHESIFYCNSSPEEEEGTVVSQKISSDTDEDIDIAELATDAYHAESEALKSPLRPDNLHLFNEAKSSFGIDNKTNERFLSIPNIRFKAEAKDHRKTARDARELRDSQPSLAGQFMRRFSKY